MRSDLLETWQQKFTASARADGFAVFREHLRRLNLSYTPEQLLHGTILVVQAIAAYMKIDGRSEAMGNFLGRQTYDLMYSAGVQYVFTFDLCGKSAGRILIRMDEPVLDMADLFAHPWDELGVAGYNDLFISHPDWSPMTHGEMESLDDMITQNLAVDNGWDEVAFNINDSLDETYLFVNVYDVDEELADE